MFFKQGCRYVHHMVQLCTNLQNIFFETRCTKFPWFYIRMCTVYSVHFVCAHYGRKMLAVLVLKLNKNPIFEIHEI